MKSQPLMSRASFAAASAGLGLMLCAASPAFAGISNFSITSVKLACTAPCTSRTVTVTGTISCPISELATVYVLIVQGRGVHAFGYAPQSCGAITTWTVTANGFPIPTKSGTSTNDYAVAVTNTNEVATVTATITP